MAQGTGARIVLFSGLGLFVALLGYLIAASLTRRAAPVFTPSPAGVPLGDGTGLDTVTVQAQDQNLWRYVDLDQGIISPPGDSTGWDLAIRRFHVRVASPPGDLGKWYHYGMLSHLLESADETYVVATGIGRTALVEILSYYCPGLEAGCLTLRYRLEPAAPPVP
ncbi:MAG TPA: HmuY family protein [Gemmatimonadales bacterium]|jgi:hypothetical protein